MRTDISTEGIVLPKLDLSEIDPDGLDDGRVFRHNGNDNITVEGGEETSEEGLYSWDQENNWWIPSGRYAHLVGGYTEDELAKQTDHDDLESNHDDLQTSHNDLEASHNDLQNEKDQLRNDHDDLQESYESHDSDTSNPHDVDYSQVGSAPQGDHDDLRDDHDVLRTDYDQLEIDHNDLRTDHDNLHDDFDIHDNSENNPHNVTYDQVDAVPASDKGSSGGVAELGGDRKVPDAQLPSLAVTDVHVLEDSEVHTDLTEAQQGDMAVYANDASKGTYILSGDDPAVDDNWTEIDHPESPVQSVFGRTGDISASSGDYHIDQIDDSVDAATFQSLEVDVSDNEDRISFNETDIEDMDSWLNDVDTNLSNLENNHNQLQSDFDGHETDYNSHTSDDSAHHTKYENSEARQAVDGSDVSIQGTADSTQNDIDNHTSEENNPHNVTANQVGGIRSDQVGNIYVSDTEPEDPNENDIWIAL